MNNKFARVAQWWSIALPRRGPRVRIPSRAFFWSQMPVLGIWDFFCLIIPMLTFNLKSELKFTIYTKIFYEWTIVNFTRDC